ncbi:MAG: hypothetical protein J5787_05775 [Alphaproteobacteria bacterium]|nr:hypothetical protein [Alphaproteobacteria bacterium]
MTDEKTRQLLEEIEFLEGQLVELKKHPFIKINPKDPTQQKATPAAKLYKDLLQQYNNSLKLLLKAQGALEEEEETSPLRRWLNERTAKNDNVDG